MTSPCLTRRLASAAVVLLAACASGGGATAASRDASLEPPISYQPPVNTVTLVLEHAPELGITDAQRLDLLAIRRGLDSMNAPLRTRLDSLRPTQRPVNPRDLSAEQRADIRARRAAVDVVRQQIQSNNGVARPRVMAVLTAEQQDKVASYEREARQRAADEASVAGRTGEEEGRRRGGRGGGGRPPRG